MRIKSLHIKGFKSLRDVTWEPGALNVIIGPNGSGKSNLLTALELLSASAQGRLAKCIQRLGGMWSILWDGAGDVISFDLLNIISENVQSIDLLYNVKLKKSDYKYGYYVLEEVLAAFGIGNDIRTIMGKNILQADAIKHEVTVFDGDGNMGSVIMTSALETALAEIQKCRVNSKDLEDLASYLGNYLIYLTLNTTRDAEIRVPPVTRYEKRVDPDGQNLITVLHTLYSEDRQFKKDIHAAMQAAFGDDFEELVFPPAADQRVQLRIRWKSLKREQSLGDISDGTLRFLFLMTVLAAPDPAPLIAIDEPETGLHPSMFPIIAEYAAQAAKKTQVVFTTHSPQFLDACGPFLPTVTVTGWKNGETTLANLDGDLLKQWLDDYSLGRMFESGDLEALA